MQINRKILLNQLFDFSQKSHGVIIGKPGVGKSFILKELKKLLLDKGILSFIIKIDNTEDASDKSIQKELKIGDRDWIETLQSIEITDGQKAVLIFDAFDAARDENIRKEYLSQIKKSKQRLSLKWNIIVSVRTYDAIKSPELIKIFPLDNYNSTISCKYIEIPILSDQELEEGLKQNSAINEIYREGQEELKQILKTPYFLILLENILKTASPQEINNLKIIRSETQLLSTYWKQSIGNTEKSYLKERLLFKITNLLISGRSLSVAKSEIINTLNSPELDAFISLRSENILDEFSVNNSRVGYSHNILFDYSVTQLCMTTDSKSIMNFIGVDFSRPFFLRPSFIYFFTQIWYDERDTFWKMYWEIQKVDQKEIQLFVRLVLNTVIASEYISLDELQPILNNSDKSLREIIIQQFLQSIRFIRKGEISSLDINLLAEISDKLEITFLWEFSFLLEKATKSLTISPEVIKICGFCARNFLSYILKRRLDPNINKNSIDRLGSTRGVELVAITYKTDQVKSKQLLEAIFSFLNDPGFEIWYFTSLTEYVKYIVSIDPEFVSKVYTLVFNHKETSDAKTNMGSSITLNLISNRHQDFDMCYYRLVEFYPEFIESNSELAIRIGLEIVNKYVIEDRLYFHADEKIQKFAIGTKTYEFISDSSAMWHDLLAYHKPAQIGQKIIAYLESLITLKKQSELEALLPIYFENAKVAYTWKIIFKLGISYPVEMENILFPFCANAVLLSSTDVVYEISKLIKLCSPTWSIEKNKAIEEAILSITGQAKKLNSSVYKNILSLLESNPKVSLQSQLPIDFVESEENSDENVGGSPKVSVNPFRTDVWLKDQGVDVNKENHQEIIDVNKQLEHFKTKFLNDIPQKADYEKLIEVLPSIFVKLKNNDLDLKLKELSLNLISDTSSIISRDIFSLSQTEFIVIKEIILYCFNFISEWDKQFNEKDSPSSGYSSTPRIASASGLINLFLRELDPTLLKIIIDGAADTNPIVRYYVIKDIHKVKASYPKEYWNLLIERIEKENDEFILGSLIRNVAVDKDSYEKINQLLKIANKKKTDPNSRSSFVESYVNLLLYLYINENHKLSKSILEDSLSSMIFCRTLVFKIFKTLDPGMLSNNYSEKNPASDLLLTLIHLILSKAEIILKNIDEDDLQQENLEVKSALEVIDNVVQRIYFSLNLNSVNKNDSLVIENKKAFYFRVKPILNSVLGISSQITRGGMIMAHTAHYFIQTLNIVVDYDAKDALSMANRITSYSMATGYTFDSMAVREIVNLTEKILADNRDLLLNSDSFNDLISLLDVYINSGWTDALQLLWKLDDIFR
jgi:hypothetical protein